MRNKLSILFLAISISGLSFAEDLKTSTNTEIVKNSESNKTIEEVFNSKSELFKNEPLSEVSSKRQEESLIKLNEVYFDKNNYNQEELFELFVAFISLGHNEAADAILNNKNVKIDINKRNSNGLTPLMAAAITPIKGGNVEYAKKLIDLGADVNKGAANSEFSPISMATAVNNYKVVGYLILKGAQFMKKDKLEYMPIDYALRNNSVESAVILKEALSVKLKEVNGK